MSPNGEQPEYLPARRKRSRLVQVTALAGTAVSLGIYVVLSAAAGRQVAGKTEGTAGLAYMLGPVRPVIVDLLWLNALEAQEQGRYYDAHFTALSLAELQPHFDQVWRFIGWNLAYNVSWDHSGARDRYFWIEQAVELLEEKGLRNNPGSMLILQELGWIHFHRLSPAGQDPFLDYFQEWLSPPAGWLEEKGFEYRGRSLKLHRGELRIYESDPVRRGEVALGPYYGPAVNRPESSFGIFWVPAAGTVPGGAAPDLEKTEAGVTLFDEPGASVARVPGEMNGSFILRVDAYEYHEGVEVALPGPGRLFLGFVPDRYECYRRSVKYYQKALMSPDARGMYGLNVGRMLAHSLESMGLFEETAGVWDLLRERFPGLRPQMEDGIRNFYHRVIYFYREEPAKQQEWYGRLREVLPGTLSIREIVEKVRRDFEAQ